MTISSSWYRFRENDFYIRYWIGNLLTIFLIAYVEYNRIHKKPAITPFALMMASIVIATSMGGLRIGLLSATLVSSYTFYSFWIGFGPTSLTGQLLNTVIGSIIFYSQAVILGLIKEHRDRTIIQLQETRQALSNEVRDREGKLQEALEKALVIERGNTLGKFATGISHDFNNILQSIMSLSELSLLQLDENHPMVQFQQDIIKQSELGSKLIHQIMDFTRKSKINEAKFELNQFLDEFAENCRRIIPKQIDIFFANNTAGTTIEFDPTHLNQILLNIIVNARDAINGQGKIVITLDNDPQENTAIISISDTGHGISDEIKSHIFEPYFTTKNRSEGTGLGLAQVWGLIQQYNGSIEVESQVDKGTKFILTIPTHATKNTDSESTDY